MVIRDATKDLIRGMVCIMANGCIVCLYFCFSFLLHNCIHVYAIMMQSMLHLVIPVNLTILLIEPKDFGIGKSCGWRKDLMVHSTGQRNKRNLAADQEKLIAESRRHIGNDEWTWVPIWWPKGLLKYHEKVQLVGY